MKIILNQSEKTILSDIESKIGSKKNMANTANFLISLNYDTLIKLYQKSDQIKNFMHSNSTMLDNMANQLKISNFISLAIQSMDGREQHDVCDHYLGALMIQAYFMNIPAARHSLEVKKYCTELLNEACKLGLYNALVIRCKQGISQATLPGLSMSDRREIIQSIVFDMQRLGNLYWSIGYLQVGSLWQMLGDYFLDNEEDKAYGALLHEEAVKDFLCAFLLRNYSMSIRILDVLTQEKGLAGFSYEENAVHTWDEFQEMIYHWLNGKQYEEIFSLAESEIATLLSASS